MILIKHKHKMDAITDKTAENSEVETIDNSEVVICEPTDAELKAALVRARKNECARTRYAKDKEVHRARAKIRRANKSKKLASATQPSSSEEELVKAGDELVLPVTLVKVGEELSLSNLPVTGLVQFI